MEKILCYSCNKSKNKLSVRKSVLLPINLLMCETCIANKLEPKWVVILAGRQFGQRSVLSFIRNKKYLGDPITANELILDEE